ncbi:vacuolar protein sorting-associated protein 16 [Histomonas meleagridis]|uniref:vacuolar protein sorting-associated protein 16 n=1 Tax=Histomonas meleagridis TaxID=135588 RepID=UPI00355A8865|nr:vacuolar protein sorting-associated protein 16 [Histomonas meleagridis]KAH0806992.1 vacuolar protein sorting-associated protein 16 [Histomonas meleagridis]
MQIIPKKSSLVNQTIIYILDNSGNILIITSISSYSVSFTSKIIKFSLSSNFAKIALVTESLNVMVCKYDLSEIIYEKQVSTEYLENFNDICWIGEVVPALCFAGGVILAVEDSDDQPTIFFETNDLSVGFTSIDSSFIITSSEAYFLRYIPQEIVKVFISHIPNPSSLLLEIYENRFSDPPIQQLNRINAREASKNLLRAAEYVTELENQLLLVNASKFALTYINRKSDGGCCEIFKAISRLRILNYCNRIANIPITSQQIKFLGNEIFIERLMNRQLHFIAIEISNILKLPIEHIVNDYTNNVIETVPNDLACFNSLTEQSNISYYYAAVSSYKNGRLELALNFIEMEQKHSLKADFYSLIGEYKESFENAILSYDNSVIFNVVKNAFANDSQIDLINELIISNETICRFLLENFDKFDDIERVSKILNLIPNSSLHKDIKQRFEIRKNKNSPVLESLKSFQPENNSINENLRRLITNGKVDDAYALAKEYKISLRNVYVIEMKVYAKQRKWNSLIAVTLNNRKDKELCALCIELMFCANEKMAVELFLNEMEKVDQKRALKLRKQVENNEFGVESLAGKNSYARNMFSSKIFKLMKR